MDAGTAGGCAGQVTPHESLSRETVRRRLAENQAVAQGYVVHSPDRR
jgi:hypothetical protein